MILRPAILRLNLQLPRQNGSGHWKRLTSRKRTTINISQPFWETSCARAERLLIWYPRIRRDVRSGKEGASRFTAGGLPTPWARAEIGSIYILRGLFKRRFEATRTEAPALAARIWNKDCPVFAELTEDDRVRLRAFQKLNQEGAEK